MKYNALFPFLALLALEFAPIKLLASQCDGNASNCTPAQLCSGATENSNGKIRWSTAPNFKRYVESARELGMDCGVIAAKETCASNVELCTVSQLCDEATYEVKGKKAWSKGLIYQKHVELAKSFGLDCGVKKSGMSELIKGTSATSEETTVTQDITVLTTVTVWLKIKDKNDKTIFEKTTQKGEEIFLPKYAGPYLIRGGMAGSVYFKIADHIYGPVGKGTNHFNNFLISPEFIERNLEKTALKAIKVQPEANGATQSLTKRPEAKPELVTTEKGNCYKNEQSCDDELLCLQATIRIDGHPIVWEDKQAFLRFVKEAKSRGLQCKVTKKCEIDNLSECTDIDLCKKWHLKHWKVKEEVFSRGFYCEYSKKALLPVDNSTFCEKFTSRGSMSGAELYWFPKEAEIEGKRRGITCGVSNRVFSQKQNVLSTTALIQRQLNRVGCNVGVADGVIGPETRKGLFAFTIAAGINYHPKLLRDESFLSKLRSYPENTCKKQHTQKSVSLPKAKSNPKISSDSSSELARLQRERELLEANINAMQMLMEQQQREANRAYKLCFGNCAMNNRAGRGNTLKGINECNRSCAPLKYGGTVVPPSWEQNKKRLQTINCDIMRLSKNHISANCR